jgi:hypothetical protein
MTISVEFVTFTAREPIQLKMSYWITTAANMFSSAMVDFVSYLFHIAHTRCDSQRLGPAPGGIHATFWLTAVRHSQRVRLHNPFDAVKAAALIAQHVALLILTALAARPWPHEDLVTHLAWAADWAAVGCALRASPERSRSGPHLRQPPAGQLSCLI